MLEHTSALPWMPKARWSQEVRLEHSQCKVRLLLDNLVVVCASAVYQFTSTACYQEQTIRDLKLTFDNWKYYNSCKRSW